MVKNACVFNCVTGNPQKRTLELSRVMSALCQKQTFCAVAKNRSAPWVLQLLRMARPSSNGMSEAISAKMKSGRGTDGWRSDTAPIDPGNRESEGLTPNHVSELRLAEVKDFVA